MSTETPSHEAAVQAREVAGQLVAQLQNAGPSLLRLYGADLAPALEQQLFFILRDRRRRRSSGWDRSIDIGRAMGRPLLATMASLRPGRARRVRTAILLREMIHAESVTSRAARR
jgi:hypothetical protein